MGGNSAAPPILPKLTEVFVSKGDLVPWMYRLAFSLFFFHSRNLSAEYLSAKLLRKATTEAKDHKKLLQTNL